jgi:ribosomal protein S18 acetylase RimI-like enzyme
MIRRATLSDVDQMAGVIMKAWKVAYTGIIGPKYIKNMNKDKFVSIFKKNIINQEEIIFVYYENGLKGFISGKEHNGEYDCEIVGLYVDPENQGKGVGKQLFQKMKEEFITKGKSRLLVWTLENADNNGFYIKMGGVKKEDKKLSYGGKSYDGVGFSFDL